jgi:5-methylcytosine-specific restriction endonuclease McrA
MSSPYYETRKEYRESHPETYRKAQREWKKRNREAVNAMRRKHYQKHKEEVKARNSEYARLHPEVYVAAASRRRTKITQAGGTYTIEQWNELCSQYDHRCLCCGNKKKLTPDHVIPVSLGGSSDIENIQPLCKPCNSSKNTKTTDYRKGKPLRGTSHSVPVAS